MTLTDAEMIKDYKATLEMLPPHIMVALKLVGKAIAEEFPDIKNAILRDIDDERLSGILSLLCATYMRQEKKIEMLKAHIKIQNEKLKQCGVHEQRVQAKMIAHKDDESSIVKIEIWGDGNLSGCFVWVGDGWVSLNAKGERIALLDLVVDETLTQKYQIEYQKMIVNFARVLSLLGNERAVIEQALIDVAKSHNHYTAGSWEEKEFGKDFGVDI